MSRAARLVRTIGVVLLAGMPTLLAGQEPPQVFVDLQGKTLRVAAPLLLLENAELTHVTADSLQLLASGAAVAVSIAELESVERLRGRSWTGALIGSAVGLVVGGLAGGLFASFGCTDPVQCTSQERSGAVWGASVGVAIGGVGGALIGSRVQSWTEVRW